MRPGSDLLESILDGPFQTRLIVDAFYDDDVTMRDLPLSDWQIGGSLDQDPPTSGTLSVAYTGRDGTGVSPRGFLDALAPYGQQVNVLLEVSVRGRADTVQIGRMRINEVPQTSDSYFRFGGRTLVAGSTVQLGIDDLLKTVARDGIRWPAPPLLTDSTYDEMQRLSGLPIVPTLPDLPTPPGLVYQSKEGGRLLAIQQLASWLGGIPVTTSFGELTVVPFVSSTDPVLTLTDAEIVTPPRSLNTEGLTNWVSGTYQEKDGTPIYAEAWVKSGPLAADGPYGRYTAYDQSDTVTNQSQADQRVMDVLARSLQQQTYQLNLSCRLDPRIENGDVILVVPTAGEPILGRVSAWKMQKGTSFMSIVLDVAQDVPAS